MKMFSFFLNFILVINSQVYSQVPSEYIPVSQTEEVKNLIRKNADETNSISSDFIQEKHLTMMAEVLNSKGRFLFRKPNDVLWEYHSPIKYAIIVQNNHFTINNDGKISTFDTESNKLFKEINSLIIMAIQGDFVDNPKFESTFFESNTLYLASLKPQDEILPDILETIEIYFEKSGLAVQQVKFIEPEGDFTLIRFNNRKKNIPINDDEFRSGQ